MPSHRVIVGVSLAAWFAVAACEADPGTVNVLPTFITASSAGGAGGDVGATTSVTTTTGEGGAGGVACECPDGLDCCGPACVNLANDPLNCGACGASCAPDQACVQGACVNPCAPDFGCEEGICCGIVCCDASTEICCDHGTSADAPVFRCEVPVNGTCPVASTSP